MFAAFTTEQKDLRRSVHDSLSALCPPGALRKAWTDREEVARLYQGLVDLGLLGVMVRAENGGLGLDARDAVLLAYECGYVGIPGPFVETAWAAAPLLDGMPEAADLLSALLAGTSRVAVLTLQNATIADLDLADWVFTVGGAGSGLWQRSSLPMPEPSVDGARRLFRAPDLGDGFSVSLEAEKQAFNVGTLGSAAFQLGLGQRMLDLTLEYAKVRQQFGRLIGSYQAVQHHLANTAVALSFAMPLVTRAAWSLAVGHPDAGLHVSMAHLRASAAADLAGRAALQVHGAIGYTTEHDLHLFLKRSWALKRVWGDETFHRQRIAETLEQRSAPQEYWDV